MEIKITEGYSKTEMGILPKGWKVYSIGELVENGIIEKPLDGNHGNIHPKSTDFVDDGIPFIMANSVCEGILDLKHCHFITKEKAENLQKGFSITGDVLLTHKGTVGNVAIVGKISTPYIMLTPQVTYYRVKDKSRITNTFIRYYFESAKFQGILQSLSGGGTRAYIGITKQRQLPFILPPLPEQKAIAQALSDVDVAIAEIDRLITKKRNIKQGAMQQLLTGKKRLPGFSGKWKLEKLDNISSEIGDGIHATPEYLEYSKYYFINGNNLIDGSIKITEKTKCVSEEEYRKYKLALSNRTILMSINGTIGNIAFFNHEKVILGKSVAYINVKPLISKQYIFYFMQTHLVNCYFEDELTGSTIRNLSLKSIRNTPISLPQSIDEQEAIAQVLTDMDAEIEALEQKRDKYKAIKQSMMQELLTGRTRLV